MLSFIFNVHEQRDASALLAQGVSGVAANACHLFVGDFFVVCLFRRFVRMHHNLSFEMHNSAEAVRAYLQWKFLIIAFKILNGHCIQTGNYSCCIMC